MPKSHDKPTLLQTACQLGNANAVEVLLALGADPLGPTLIRMNTPFHYAASGGSVSCLHALVAWTRILSGSAGLELGINRLNSAPTPCTPLDHAMKMCYTRGDPEFAAVLRGLGAKRRQELQRLPHQIVLDAFNNERMKKYGYPAPED